jgi:hypothetical protein
MKNNKGSEVTFINRKGEIITYYDDPELKIWNILKRAWREAKKEFMSIFKNR